MKMHIANLVDVLAEHGTALCAHADNATGRLHQLVRRKEHDLPSAETISSFSAYATYGCSDGA